MVESGVTPVKIYVNSSQSLVNSASHILL